MAAKVGTLVRIMNGGDSHDMNESSSSSSSSSSSRGGGKSTALITRDLLGGCCTLDSKELDLDLQVPSGWEKHLDLKNPDALSLPPEGPNSGYLVVQDEESETYCCFGLCKNHDIMDLPFPQNKKLTVRYEAGDGENKIILKEDVMFITVLNKPLSSNHYYAIKPHGESKGQAFTCSKEEDKQNCCFCRCIRDVKPKPLDPEEVYQQYEISLYVTSCSGKGSFFAKSLAPDGFPPRFLRRKGWHLCAKTPKNYELSDDALGLNVELRKQLPEFNLTPFGKSFEAVVVGKWYCPFMFIKDGTVKEQMERSMFYEMTLGTEMGAVFHFVKMNTMKGIQYLWMLHLT